MDALGVSPADLARAVGVANQAIHTRIRADFSGPGALRYLAVMLLCSEEALTAASPDAARAAWRPGVSADRWLPAVAAIIREGRPLPTFEAARVRVLEAIYACGKRGVQ